MKIDAFFVPGSNIYRNYSPIYMFTYPFKLFIPTLFQIDLVIIRKQIIFVFVF